MNLAQVQTMARRRGFRGLLGARLYYRGPTGIGQQGLKGDKGDQGAQGTPGSFSVPVRNITGTAIFTGSGLSQTIYNDVASLLPILSITLPSVTAKGQVCRYATKAVATIVSVSGTVSVGATVTTLLGNVSIAWMAVDTTGTFIRIN